MQFARIAGGIGTIAQGGTSVQKLMNEDGYPIGRAILHVTTGYDASAPETETLTDKAVRAFEKCWWPAIVGEGVHQVIGNPKGAFNTGFGMKLNAQTPKGMNF